MFSMVQFIYNNLLASFRPYDQRKTCLKVFNKNFSDNLIWFFCVIPLWDIYKNEGTIAYALKR